MKRSIQTLSYTALVGLFALSANLLYAQEQKRQEPPEFTPGGYRLPMQSFPHPRAEIFAWIDVAILIFALFLTAYFTLKKRSRDGIRVMSIFSIFYFGFYRQGCICPVGSIQNVALTIFHSSYALPLTTGLFFILPLAFALFLGRVFCAGVCPLGAIQDIVLLRPRKMPAALDHALSVIPYVYLGAAILFAATSSLFIICKFDPFISFYRFAGLDKILVYGSVFLLISTVIGRPYCRYMCPYGVLLGWFSYLAKWKANITPSKCINCHLCANACPFGAITPPVTDKDSRETVRRRTGALLFSIPLVITAFTWLAYKSSPILAAQNPTVSLANRIWQETHGQAAGHTEESKAFIKLGDSADRLYYDAARIRRTFDIGSLIFGAWIGIVISAKLLSLSKRKHQTVYEADPSSCYACARCYRSCPVEVNS